jgi:hypothetical protein
LYDIPHDPGEENDVAGKEPGVVAALTAKALEWVRTLPASEARNQVKAHAR